MTNRELTLGRLLGLWLFLFGAGSLVTTAGIWLEPGNSFYQNEPYLLFVWFGQVLLFLCTWYFKGGLRDNEVLAFSIIWYKLLSGGLMLLLPLRADIECSGFIVFGGVLDLVMGVLTATLWLRARRSKATRIPMTPYAEAIVDEEPDTPLHRVLVGLLWTAMGFFGLVAVALAWLAFHVAPNHLPEFVVAAGNALGAYGCLAATTMLAAEAPRRRPFALDIVVLANLVGGVGMLYWVHEFPPPAIPHWPLQLLGIVHLATGILVVGMSAISARGERETAFFAPREHRTLEAFSRVIIRGDIEPVLPREIADKADTYLASVHTPRRATIRLALNALELAPLLRGKVPLSKLGRQEREAYLERRFVKGRGTARDLMRVRQLATLFYYTDRKVHEDIGYVPLERRQRYLDAEAAGQIPTGPVSYPKEPSGSEFSTDVCVIGTGAGGGIVARRLAELGVSVLMLEEGPYLKRDRIKTDELTMQREAYRENGLQNTLDMDMVMLQGRAVGGTTLLNNGICFEVRDEVLDDWERDLGITIDRDRLRDAYESVRAILKPIYLGDHLDVMEKGAAHFVRGCQSLGFSSDYFHVNLKGECIGCGFCTTACRFEKKDSMDLLVVPQALALGAELLSECRATRLRSTGSGWRVECKRGDGSTAQVNAKHVVVSCGTVHSSLLLQDSGIRGPVGERMSMNVGTPVFAEFNDPIDSFDGLQMCAYAERRSYFLETIAMPPGSFAASMPGWFRDHFENMRRFRYYAAAGVLMGTRANGRIRRSKIPIVGKWLTPIDFTLHAHDLVRLREGVKDLARVWLAAGARRVLPATYRPISIRHPSEIDRLDDFIVEADDLSLGTAHPQGGNPIGVSARDGLVNAYGRVHGYDGLSVVDASIFPTSIRINPQLTIMAFAQMAADEIGKTLKGRTA